jgi:Asp-tRNA(Asn)/Glu-tRNA(Gln) amidotransferase A subunit family amidase
VSELIFNSATKLAEMIRTKQASPSYTMTYNVLGLPGAVVPCGRSPEGLLIGVQIVGRPFEEETVLAVAALLEESLGGYQRPPI